MKLAWKFPPRSSAGPFGFCRTVLWKVPHCEKPCCRILTQNRKGSAELWEPSPALQTRQILLLITTCLTKNAPKFPDDSGHLFCGTENRAHRNRSDLCDLRLRCPSRTPEIARFPKQETAMMHCDLRVQWKVASDLRFRAAISEPKTSSCCGISGDSIWLRQRGNR